MSTLGNETQIFTIPDGSVLQPSVDRIVIREGNFNVLTLPTGISNVDPTNVINITTTTGIPNGLSAPVGSLAMDSLTDIPYIQTSTGWTAFQTGGLQTLAQTLIAGNTTGANDIVVSSPRHILFNGNVFIGANGVNPSSTGGTSNIMIGENAAKVGGSNNVMIGPNAIISTATSNSVIIGSTSGKTSTGDGSVAINGNCTGPGGGAGQIAISGTVSGTAGIALGGTSSGNLSIVFGNGATDNGFASAVAIGPGSSITAANQIMMGVPTTTVVMPGGLVTGSDAVLGNSLGIRGGNSSGAGNNGGDLNLTGGTPGAGGTAGSIILNSTASAVSQFNMPSGVAALNTLNLLKVTGITGTPTSAPTGGQLVYDQTNGDFLYYNAVIGSWISTSTPTYESYSVAGGANRNPINTFTTSFVTTTGAGNATGTLANGSYTGQIKYLIVVSYATDYVLSATNVIDANGAAVTTITFVNAGASVSLTWHGGAVNKWFVMNSGANFA
jgi:hypothetical protein